MRVLGRLLAGLVAVLALLAVVAAIGFFVFGGTTVGFALRAALSGMGLENPSLTVRAISLTRIEIEAIRAGSDAADPELAIERLTAEYHWRELLFERRARSLKIGPGAARIVIDRNGVASLAGMPLGEERGGGGPLPFDSLSIEALDVRVRSGGGEAAGNLAGHFSPDDGGAFDFTAAAKEFSAPGAAFDNAAAKGSIQLEAGGAARAAIAFRGDAIASGLSLRGVDFELSAVGSNWREAVAGRWRNVVSDLQLDLRAAEIDVRASPLLEVLAREEYGPHGPGAIETLRAAGGFTIRRDERRLALRAAAPLIIVSDRGDELTVSGRDGRALYEADGTSQQVEFAVAISGGPLRGEGKLTARADEAGPFRFDADARLAGYEIGPLRLAETTLVAAGEAQAGVIRAETTMASAIDRLALGMLTTSDAPLAASLFLTVDLPARALTLTGPGRCALFDRARFAYQGQDMEAALAAGAICETEEPLLRVQWTESPDAVLKGRFTARSARYRLGETRIEGEPPRFDFVGRYDPIAQTTVVEGDIAEGRVVFNGAIAATASEGSFRLTFAEGVSGETTVRKTRIAQTAEVAHLAPILARGTATLADDRVDFDYAATTPSGVALGTGRGFHDLAAARGETQFRTTTLDFRPNVIQPAQLAPGLRGVIGETTGKSSGEVRFAWGAQPENFSSSGAFAFSDLTFRGPGIAVSETAGVTGEIELASLAPLRSAGAQTITVERIDMNALMLEDGSLTFDMPGDETIRVLRAEFPWFGGTIGAYDAVSTLTGSDASIPLRVDNIDLALVLEYVNVNGLSGEGVLSGSLPLIIEEGKASIKGGELIAKGPGALRYVGTAAQTAAATGDQAEIAFSILRDLRYHSLRVLIDGALDGRVEFKLYFEGTGEVPFGDRRARLPVKYNLTLDAALMELLHQANITHDIRRQIERARQGGP